MKKLYIISNYINALYELDENNNCKVPIRKDGEKEIIIMPIEQAIELFKQNTTVKTFGIIQAFIQENIKDNEWKIVEQILPKTPKKNPLMESIRKKIPLKTMIFTNLQLSDYENWSNGEYKGDNEIIIKTATSIMQDVFQWIENGMPGGKDIDLSEFKNLKEYDIFNVE